MRSDSFVLDDIEYRCFDHLFAVSRCGKVLRKMQPYVPRKHPMGYLQLGRERLMHRVVAACWCDRPSNATQVHHINGNKADNRADNLEWLSARDHQVGRHHVGERAKHPKSEATRKRLSDARRGVRDDDETRAKKAAILDAVRVKVRPIVFQGIAYRSVSAAARAHGMALSTFRKRHLPKHDSRTTAASSEG